MRVCDVCLCVVALCVRCFLYFMIVFLLEGRHQSSPGRGKGGTHGCIKGASSPLSLRYVPVGYRSVSPACRFALEFAGLSCLSLKIYSLCVTS